MRDHVTLGGAQSDKLAMAKKKLQYLLFSDPVGGPQHTKLSETSPLLLTAFWQVNPSGQGKTAAGRHVLNTGSLWST